MKNFPEPVTGAVIINPENKVLLVKSHKWHENYSVPGGHVELGETLENSVKREVKEETGLEIHDLEFLGVQEFIFDKIFWKKKHFLFFDYMCKTDCKEVTLNSEASRFIWISPKDALKRRNVSPYAKRSIKWSLKKGPMEE
ncbi:ADP-ribose pyrophosphatase [Candidatus Micrarchaeota archaeon CG10_big_fil_rev_8_21_14_0_10_54_18]|nr:MAG: hypothetical protein AUJ15_03135 [Candidatus Micrarchaeota archaeon CG1_02_55_41]PJD01441.1 MAG: ADP-ribose pyrophosphatase [Candidatus Micrarchaeota archaeon CG10_big_fil_rev_8_21_14_0_10_54_18]